MKDKLLNGLFNILVVMTIIQTIIFLGVVAMAILTPERVFEATYVVSN